MNTIPSTTPVDEGLHPVVVHLQVFGDRGLEHHLVFKQQYFHGTFLCGWYK